MITLILGVFHRFCKSARSASRKRGKFIECLHSNGSATYLHCINYLGRKNDTFCNEIEIKSISLNCYSKYLLRRVEAVLLPISCKILPLNDILTVSPFKCMSDLS